MFKATLSNPKLFKTIFTTISYIIDEVKLEVDSEGIRLRTTDRENTIFVGLNLKPTLFDEYVCDDPETLSFDIFTFMKALNLVSSDDEITLSCDDYKLILIFEGDYESRFEIGFIEIDRETRSPPDFEFPVNLELSSKSLNEILKKIYKISEKEISGTIEVDEDYFRVYGGSEFIKSDFKYLHGEKVDTSVKTVFTLEKMINIMKASSITDVTELGIGTNFPMSIKFVGVSEDYILEFLLAPRIEEEK